MKKIKIHNPCNEETRYYRYYNLFWDILTHELKKYFYVEENRYFSKANIERYSVQLENNLSNEILIQECDYIIENCENKEFSILSVCDILTAQIIQEKENPFLKKVLFSQYDEIELFGNNELLNSGHIKSEYRYKYSPWIYFQHDLTNLEEFYFKRKYRKKFDNTLFFKGAQFNRPILEYFPESFLPDLFLPNTTNSKQYFNKLITHKVALSIGGLGEFCFRDVEYMALGIPFIRFEYKNKMNIPLIPNFHYISVDRPNDLMLDRDGKKNHAEMLIDRYYEVINDNYFLEYISKNARNYYEENLMYPNNIKNTLKQLEIDQWLKN